jgi:hypothetical protein
VVGSIAGSSENDRLLVIAVAVIFIVALLRSRPARLKGPNGAKIRQHWRVKASRSVDGCAVRGCHGSACPDPFQGPRA